MSTKYHVASHLCLTANSFVKPSFHIKFSQSSFENICKNHTLIQEMYFQVNFFVGLTKNAGPDTQCQHFKKRTLPFSRFRSASFQVATCDTLQRMDLPLLFSVFPQSQINSRRYYFLTPSVTPKSYGEQRVFTKICKNELSV